MMRTSFSNINTCNLYAKVANSPDKQAYALLLLRKRSAVLYTDVGLWEAK